MPLFFVFYYVLTGIFMIWCSLQKPGKLLRCIVISPLWLRNYQQRLASVIIIELRGRNRTLLEEALVVPPAELSGVLRWIPPQTTLVLGGKSEFDACRVEIERILLKIGIEVVYIVDEDDGRPSDEVVPKVPTCEAFS